MKKLFDFSQPGLAETLLPTRIDTKTATAWVGHIPFAYYIVEKTRPHVIVELGVHGGNSFFAFADAVKALELDCLCFGVDTFQGDKHAGFYGDEIYKEVLKFCTENYPGNIMLVKGTFDNAVEAFENSTIDILHIDGCHTYEDTRHNFETWLPKLKPDGFVLFHDTMITRDDFGVWKLWNELGENIENDIFNFIHSCGLGVLQFTKGQQWEFNEPEKAMKYFEDLGETILPEFQNKKRMPRSSFYMSTRGIERKAEIITGSVADRIIHERKRIVSDHVTICLTFICRDNEKTIKRMIESCLPFVDCVVACDTGSVDRTKEIIMETCRMHGISYEIFSNEWVNFGHNRSLMMQHARGVCDYIFVMDTDETLEIRDDFQKDSLDADIIMIPTSDGVTTYYRDRIFKDTFDWKYIGAAHEFPSGEGASSKYTETALNLRLYPKENNNHIQRNYDLLLKDHEKNPHDTRTLFYLGESAFDLGKNEEALKYHKQRSDIPFYPEESWYSLYKIGRTYERMKNWDMAETAYLKAYGRRSSRMEPMYHLAMSFAQRNDHVRACSYFEIAIRVPYPKTDMLFVEDYLYRYNCMFYYCISLYYSGRYQECFDLSEKFTEKKDLMPPETYDRHLKNIVFCELQLIKQGWRDRYVLSPADMRFDGLGDNLLHSHLAGLAKKKGFKKVYLSSLMKFKTPGTKEIIYLNNPAVDGEIERYGIHTEDQWAKNILSGDVSSFDMEYMKMIALSHGFYEEGKDYLPVIFKPTKSDIEIKPIEGTLFDGYGKTNIANENKIRRYFAKFGLPLYQITIDNVESDINHSNAILKRIYLNGVDEIHVKNIYEYYDLLSSFDKIICLTSATAILVGAIPRDQQVTVLTDTNWMAQPMAKCHMRPYNEYFNLDKI